MNKTEAYRRSYNVQDRNASWIKNKGQLLYNLPHVKARCDELFAELAKRSEWTRDKAINKLMEAFEKADKATDYVSIVKELNAMHGYNMPIKEIQGVVANFTMNIKNENS